MSSSCFNQRRLKASQGRGRSEIASFRFLLPMITLVLTIALVTGIALTIEAAFRAGAAKTDITPNWFPVMVNGSMTSRSVDTVTSPISTRSAIYGRLNHLFSQLTAWS